MLERIHRWLPLRVGISLVVIGLWALIFPPADLKIFIEIAVALIAGFAWFESRRSADAASKSAAIADANEERSRYGWVITLHPNGDHYVLRNVGTLAAHDVKFGNSGDRPPLARFLVHQPGDGPTIQPGQAKAFNAISTFSDPIVELVIDWLPQGETSRQSFNEAVPPISSKGFDEHVKERKAETAAEALAHERVITETRRLLIELAAAWANYQEDPSAGNRIRVQGLVGALPTNFVKEIGRAVDVPRDHWGPHQYPLEVFVQSPEDRELVRRDAPLVELIWNLWQVQLPGLVDADLSQSPRYWYRIEHAIHGYVELVRNRESGRRELIEGPRDRKQREDAQQMFKQVEAMRRSPQAHPQPRPSEGP
jgi:hypothetical protein